MHAALVRRDGVDFVDDDGARGGEHLAAGYAREQDVQRLRRGHQDMRGLAAHALTVRLGRVARAHDGADIHVRQTRFEQLLANAGQRFGEILLDVVRQCFERRHVHDMHFVAQVTAYAEPNQRIDGREKGGQRLARTGWRGNQRIAAGTDRRPGLDLRFGRGRISAAKPVGNGGMKGVEDAGRVGSV